MPGTVLSYHGFCIQKLAVDSDRHCDSSGRMHKIQSLVNYPVQGLDLAEFVDPASELPLEQYDLFAVSNHHGILGGGEHVLQTN